jgi:hypothetical protein
MTIKPGTNYTVTKHSGIGGVISVTKDPVSPTISGRLHLNTKTYVIPNTAVANADYTVEVNHGLSDGETVVYHSMGYTRGVDSTRPILRNERVMNPQTSEVDIANNTITDANLAHGCETGDVIFHSNGGGTTMDGVDNNSDYYVIKVDDNTIKLATSYDNAINGDAEDITGTGNNAQSLYKYFQDSEVFYARKKTDDQFYLHDTQADALAGTNTIVINDGLKGNTTQTFSTSFGRLDPTTDA